MIGLSLHQLRIFLVQQRFKDWSQKCTGQSELKERMGVSEVQDELCRHLLCIVLLTEKMRTNSMPKHRTFIDCTQITPTQELEKKLHILAATVSRSDSLGIHFSKGNTLHTRHDSEHANAWITSNPVKPMQTISNVSLEHYRR